MPLRGEKLRFAVAAAYVSWLRFIGDCLLLALRNPRLGATDKTVTFKIPPVKIPVNVKDQRITMVASGLITLTSKAQGLNILNLQLTADMSDLQQNMTELLGAQLDKDDHCGDRITIQHATLTPAEPASLAVVQLHYERWACAKVFGKEQAKRVVGGNAVIQMTLTPARGGRQYGTSTGAGGRADSGGWIVGGTAALGDARRHAAGENPERDPVGHAKRNGPQRNAAARGAGLREDQGCAIQGWRCAGVCWCCLMEKSKSRTSRYRRCRNR